MTGWLLKTEPSEYSFDRLLKEGRARWDGVTNSLALKHLREVRRGDPVMIYHTGDRRAVVGLANAASDAYPDPKAKDPKLVVIDVEPVQALSQPVTLESIKGNPVFGEFALVRQGRLSVMPVPKPL